MNIINHEDIMRLNISPVNFYKWVSNALMHWKRRIQPFCHRK